MTNRRQFLGTMGATALVGMGALSACHDKTSKPTHSPTDTKSTNRHPFADLTYDFYGTHQAGITTPTQRHSYFLVADLHTTDVKIIQQMFKDWTESSVKLMRGDNIKPYAKNPHVPPTDTGEADSLGAYGLTLTFGVSPSFLDKLGLSDKNRQNLATCPNSQETKSVLSCLGVTSVYRRVVKTHKLPFMRCDSLCVRLVATSQ